MDRELLSRMISELIVDNDVVGLPGVGSFVAELVPASFSDRGFTINPPYRRLSFKPNCTEDQLLVNFYSEKNNVPIDLAKEYIFQFLIGLRDVLREKKSVTLPGLGRLRATKENNFFFVPDESLDIFPETYALKPVSLKSHPLIEEKNEIPFTFKMKNTTEKMQEEIADSNDLELSVDNIEFSRLDNISFDTGNNTVIANECEAISDNKEYGIATATPRNDNTVIANECEAISDNKEYEIATATPRNDEEDNEKDEYEIKVIEYDNEYVIEYIDAEEYGKNTYKKTVETVENNTAETSNSSEQTIEETIELSTESTSDIESTTEETAIDIEPTIAETTETTSEIESTIEETAIDIEPTIAETTETIENETIELVNGTTEEIVTEPIIERIDSAKEIAVPINETTDTDTEIEAEAGAKAEAEVETETETELIIDNTEDITEDPRTDVENPTTKEVEEIEEVFAIIPPLVFDGDQKIEQIITEEPIIENKKTQIEDKEELPTKKSKKFKWWMIPLLLFVVFAIAVAAFFVLASIAPDFIDSLLYTPEELWIINY